MQSTIESLKQERERLANRIAEIDTAIFRFEQWMQDVSVLLTDSTDSKPQGETQHSIAAQHVTHSLEPMPSVGPQPELAPPPQTPIREFERIAREVLSNIDHPMQRAEMLELLSQQGVVIHSKDPANAMGTRFSRMGGVINLKPYGFWLASRDYPPAGYKAPSSADDEFLITP